MKSLLPDLWRNTFYDDYKREFLPSVDVEEAGDHYMLSFDLPGMKKENVKINVQDNVLTVSGERKDEREEKTKTKYLSERYYGTFTRSFSLPAGIRTENIEADYRDGVLKISIPKAAASKGRDIRIGEGKRSAEKVA